MREMPLPDPRPASPAAPRLPTPLSGLVGRESELATLAQLLKAARLVTLTGAGGVGKTRLALAVAAAEVERFGDGVWLVSLGSVVDPALVQHAVAATFGLREPGRASPLEALAEALHARRCLLVLDNCEHLIDACAELVEPLLQRCAELTILATSREPLRVPGEATWRVPSLRAPRRPAPPVDQLVDYEAVRLFVERAVAVRPDFSLTPTNADAVAEVCSRLDGIPLAIELAAAWLRTLNVDQLAARLDDRLDLLVGGSRTAPPRQQTLRGAIEWSYDLLSPPERQLLAALSVFAGGWTVEAAEAVCTGDGLAAEDILGLLRQLIDKSLVVVDHTPDGPRYRLLESLRAYAQERAQAAGVLPELQRRHLAWCLALARAVMTAPWPDPAHVQGLAREQDNLRAALRSAIAAGEALPGLRLAVALWPLWYQRGLYTEARGWLGELLAMPGASAPTWVRARALAFAGRLACLQGQLAEAEGLLREGLSTAEQADARLDLTLCSHFLADLARRRGALAEATAQYEHTLERARATGQRHIQAWAAYYLAEARFELGHTEDARQALEQATHLSADPDDPRLEPHLVALAGRLATAEGDHASARALEARSLALLQTIGDQQSLALASLDAAASARDRGERAEVSRRLAMALVLARDSGEQLALARGLEGVAELVADARAEDALRLGGTAAALRASLGLELSAREREQLEGWLGAVRRRVGAAHAAAVWDQARGAPVSEAVALAVGLAESASAPAPAPHQQHDSAQLTPREREVVRLLARGLTNRQIAEALTISEGTARIHVQRVLAKLGLRSRVYVAEWARSNGCDP